MEKAVMEVNLPFPRLGGKDENKIREMYDLSEITSGTTIPKLGLMINTDRISTGDVVMPTGIPGKGKVLTKISAEIFGKTRYTCPNHLWSDKLEKFPEIIQRELLPYKDKLDGRSMLIYLAKPIKAEAIVRIYLTGSGYKSYAQTGTVCGVKLPPRLKDGDRLQAPTFTPTTKAPIGQHDQPLTLDELAVKLSEEKDPNLAILYPNHKLAGKVKAYALSLASEISTILAMKGIVLRDTKFEFGMIPHVGMAQIDETATPDSSRYDPDYSKQPFRDAMTRIGFDGETPMEVPDWLVGETSGNYRKMCQLITGKDVV